MSDRTTCNFCTLLGLDAVARNSGRHLTALAAPLAGYPKGVDVHIHPPDYIPTPREGTAIPPDGDIVPVGVWWAGWLAEVPAQCVLESECRAKCADNADTIFVRIGPNNVPLSDLSPEDRQAFINRVCGRKRCGGQDA